MEEKQFKEVLEKNNNQISKIFEKKLNLSFDIVMEKVDNRLIKHSKELKKDYNRQGRFLLDEFKHQTSIVAEQYGSLNNKVDNLDKKVSNLDKKVSNLDNKVSNLDNKVGNLDKKLDGVVGMVGKNTVDIEIIKEDIQIIKSGFKKKVDIEEFEALEKRVILLERKFHSV